MSSMHSLWIDWATGNWHAIFLLQYMPMVGRPGLKHKEKAK